MMDYFLLVKIIEMILFSNNRSALVSVNFIMDLFQQVLQISRVGGRNIKDCVHKVLDRYLQHFQHVLVSMSE